MPLSEPDEARKADLEELASKLAGKVRMLRESGSALGRVPAAMDPTEFAIQWALIEIHGVLYAGGPDYDQVRRVLGLP